MQKWKLFPALLSCLLLTACAAPEEPKNPSVPETAVLGEAAGVPEEETLLTVDGQEIPAWRYLYWLAFTCDQIQARYEEAGAVLDWNAPADGGTLSSYAKGQALEDTVLYAAVENWAASYRCALDGKDRDAVKSDWARQAKASGGEEAFLAELACQGLDRARWEILEETGRLYAKLCALYEAEEGPFQTPAPQPAKTMVDRLLVSAGADREAAQERAAELFSRLNTAADQAAEFAALAAASDDSAGPRVFTPGGTFSAPLEEAALSLEPGQLSGIVESEEGFSILRRMEEKTDPETKERRPEFDEFLQAAAEKAEVETTAAYEEIDPAVFSRSLRNVRANCGFSSS